MRHTFALVRKSALIASLALLMMAGMTSQRCAAQSRDENEPPQKSADDQGKSAAADTKPRLATLDEMLGVALKHNPDVRAATARLQTAEAELERTRLDVVQKLIAFRERWLQQFYAVKQIEAELQQAKAEAARLKASSSAVAKRILLDVEKNVRVSEQALELATSKLAEIEAELPFLLGRRTQGQHAPVEIGIDALNSAPARQAAADLLETARETYKLGLSAARGGENLDLEGINDWSRRWMEAELRVAETKQARIAAVEAHLDRARQLQQLAEAAFKASAVAQTEVTAMRYYVAEAELRLEQAKDD